MAAEGLGRSTRLGLQLKRRTLQTNVSNVFQSEDSDESEGEFPHDKKAKVEDHLEDPHSKSKRLEEKGVILAESERYLEAISHWDMALELTPECAELHEMKAQSLLELGEEFPAVASAEKAVAMAPQWSAAWQTLGRTQLNIGEVEMALNSFQKAVHLDPGNKELWQEDLLWAWELVQRKTRTSDPEQIE